jgi:oligoendopeptidase F
MTVSGRPTPDVFAEAGWDDVAPWYDELASRPLDLTTVDAWLAEWSALEEALEEARTLAWIDHTLDTADPVKEAAHLRFAGEIGPRRHEQGARLTGRLLDLDYTRPDLETMLRRFRNQRDLFRPANIPLQEELEELNARYSRITGGMTATWDGEELPLPLLEPFLLDPDRAVRERAYRLRVAPFLAARDELASIFDAQFALRQQIARNAGSAEFRDYAFRDFNRFDYTPADCETFHRAVAETVVPALGRRRARRREQLGFDTLRPWDVGPDPLGRPPLRPFADAAELIARTQAAFDRLDPELGGYFATMASEGLLDLESRTGKQPLGYSSDLPYRRRPFIFMNAAGVAQDVVVLLHEAGHSFHSFETYALPLVFQRDPGSEMGEVGSMAMELLAAPHLGRANGGFYEPEDERRARAEHLESILDVLTLIAQGDAFQHWLYASGEGDDPSARDAAWRRLSDRFDPGVDWDGLEAERSAGWYRVPHFFMIPFYFIEYGIAQLGALQIWQASKRDERAAVAAYRRALALGGTKPLPQLFAAAGARLAFDAQTMGALVATIEEELANLDD